MKLSKELDRINWDYLIKEIFREEDVDREEAIAELYPYVEKWLKHIIEYYREYPNIERRRCRKCNMLIHPYLEEPGYEHRDCGSFIIRICI